MIGLIGCDPFVIVKMETEFLREMLWPGVVDIGSRIDNVGSSSVRLEQALFQSGRCISTARSVVALAHWMADAGTMVSAISSRPAATPAGNASSGRPK